MRGWLIGMFLLLSTVLVAEDNNRVMIVLDASRGMQGKIGKSSRLMMAKKSLNHVLGKSKSKIDVGLTLFGHRSKKDCHDIEPVIDISPLDKKKFRTTLKSVKAQGKAPLLVLLKTVAKEMKYQEQKTTIILIASSQDTCHPDPCSMVKTLVEKGKDLKIHVLGMKVKKRAKKQLACIAKVTGGHYFTIKNQKGLDTSLEMLIKEIAYRKPKPKRVYIPDVMPRLNPIPLLEKKKNTVQITASEIKGAKKIDIHGYIYAIDKEGIVNKGKVWALNQHHKNNINNYKLPLGKYIMTVEYNAFTKEVAFEIKANKKNKVHVIMGQTGKVEISAFNTSNAKSLSIDGYIYPVNKKGKIANMYIKKIHHDTKRIFSIHRLLSENISSKSNTMALKKRCLLSSKPIHQGK